jgi:hypothetical protein
MPNFHNLACETFLTAAYPISPMTLKRRLLGLRGYIRSLQYPGSRTNCFRTRICGIGQDDSLPFPALVLFHVFEPEEGSFTLRCLLCTGEDDMQAWHSQIDEISRFRGRPVYAWCRGSPLPKGKLPKIYPYAEVKLSEPARGLP